MSMSIIRKVKQEHQRRQQQQQARRKEHQKQQQKKEKKQKEDKEGRKIYFPEDVVRDIEAPPTTAFCWYDTSLYSYCYYKDCYNLTNYYDYDPEDFGKSEDKSSNTGKDSSFSSYKENDDDDGNDQSDDETNDSLVKELHCPSVYGTRRRDTPVKKPSIPSWWKRMTVRVKKRTRKTT